jgi:predicted negative regulator of RcsB-dependent stress response
MGNLTRALELCAQTEELLTSVGMENSTEYLLLLDTRGNILFQKSEYQEVRQLYAQIIKKTSATCSFRYHAHALRSVAEMDILMESEVADIVSNLKAAETVEMTLVSPDILTPSLLDAQLKLYCGDTENARAALLECLSKGLRTRTGRALVRDCLAALADPVHKMHGTMDTFCWAVVYLASVQIAKNPVGTLHALRRLAVLHLSLEDDETALHIFHAVLEGGTEMDIHRLRAECMVGIGDIVLRRGNPIEAKEMWGGAHPLFVRSSRLKEAASIRLRLESLSHTQHENSRTLPKIPDGVVGESTDSVSVASIKSSHDITAELGDARAHLSLAAGQTRVEHWNFD